MIKQSSHDAGFNTGVRAFMYIVVTKHLNWDMSFLGKDLSAHMDECVSNGVLLSLSPSDEPHASPSTELLIPPLGDLLRTPSGQLLAIPPPPEVHREQVIEDDSVVQIEESDRSGDDLELIDDARRFLDHEGS